jgi:hypothetical protein
MIGRRGVLGEAKGDVLRCVNCYSGSPGNEDEGKGLREDVGGTTQRGLEDLLVFKC